MSAEDTEIDSLSVSLQFSTQPPFPKSRLKNSLDSRNLNVIEDDSGEYIIAISEDRIITYSINEGSISLAIKEFEKSEGLLKRFEDMVFSELDGDRDDLVKADVNLSARYWCGKDTRTTFSKYYDSPDLEEIFGKKAEPYGIRLHSKGQDEKDTNYDIRLEPYLSNSNYYYIEIAYNQLSLEQVHSFVRSTNEKIEATISALEEGVNNGNTV